MNNKKVYIVTCWHDYLTKYDDDIFMNFVVANNEEEARQIVEDNIWTLSGMGIKEISEIDLSESKYLCWVPRNNFE